MWLQILKIRKRKQKKTLNMVVDVTADTPPLTTTEGVVMEVAAVRYWWQHYVNMGIQIQMHIQGGGGGGGEWQIYIQLIHIQMQIWVAGGERHTLTEIQEGDVIEE